MDIERNFRELDELIAERCWEQAEDVWRDLDNHLDQMTERQKKTHASRGYLIQQTIDPLDDY